MCHSFVCQRCGHCCQYFKIDIIFSPESRELLEVALGRYMAVLEFDYCRELNEDMTCAVYDSRPTICRKFKCIKGEILLCSASP